MLVPEPAADEQESPVAKMTLSMKPTGWFQVAWSAELAVGEVKPIHYFDRDMVLYRTSDGRAHVLDAYCEHLGAHLGYGGKVKDDVIVCPFHGWEWDAGGRNVCIPYQENPNRARRIRSWDVRERNESIFIWHDLLDRDPMFDVPDVFTMFSDGASADDYYPSYPKGCCSRQRLEIHPQYVIENGVDFAHFKFVHRTDAVPSAIEQHFDEWTFSATFDMAFRPSRSSAVATDDEVVNAGVQAHNVGISLGYSVTWASDRLRLQVGVTPVDEHTSDIWSTVWLERLPGDNGAELPAPLDGRIRIANNQFLADVNIWEHQRYTDPPGLATSETRSFTTLRKWATRFYPAAPDAPADLANEN